jgi:hypothetical protein
MLYQFIVFLLLLFGIVWLCLNNSKFEFQEMSASNMILRHQMISTENAMKIKVVELIKIYNFCFGHLFMSLNFKF